jgi:hypothetical protein
LLSFSETAQPDLHSECKRLISTVENCHIRNRTASDKLPRRQRVLMRRLRFFAVLILALTPPLLWPQVPEAAPEPLWYWFGACSDKTHMGLEVLLDGEVIHRSSFPICPIIDRSKETDHQQKIVAFSFKGGHVFQGEYHTTRTQMIEGNIWQAGTDPGTILFGISFSTKKQVLLNTIHVAKSGSGSTSEIDRGLFVRTFPISGKGF